MYQNKEKCINTFLLETLNHLLNENNTNQYNSILDNDFLISVQRCTSNVTKKYSIFVEKAFLTLNLIFNNIFLSSYLKIHQTNKQGKS